MGIEDICICASHAVEQHPVGVGEGYHFVIGIGHGHRQVGGVVGERRDELSAAGNLFVFGKDAPARIVRPLGVVPARDAHRGAAANSVRAAV